MKTPPNSASRLARTALAAFALLCSGGLSQAALTLKYSFDDITGTTVPNSAPSATINGTLVTGNAIAPIVEPGGSVTVGGIPYPLGNVVRFAPAGDGDADANTPYIQTNGSISLWGMASNVPYTAMAWVKFNNQNGDNMVFGDLGGNRLHHGARGANYHSGNWGDDVTGGTTQPGVWHHVAWTNDAGNNNAIYVDGVLTVGPGSNGTGGIEYGDNVVLGTSGNGGSLSGSIDDVKIFNTLLTPAQIQAEMTSTLLVPDPDIVILGNVIGSTTGNQFGVRVILKDGNGAGKQVVPAQITGVTIGGVAATITGTSKSGTLTTINALLPGAYAPGQQVYNVHVLGTDAGTTAYDLNKNVTGPILPPVASLAGSFGSGSTPWGVREYTTSMTGSNAATAIGVVLTNSGGFGDFQSPAVNYFDPQAPSTQGDFNNNIPFPGNTAGDDDHVFVGKMQVTIPAPGPYTLNIHTDDGVALKITGVACTAVYGGSALDPSDQTTVTNTGVANSLAVYNFPAAGIYDLAIISVDTGGPGMAELSWAVGSVDSNDERQLPWTLVGNPSVLPPTTSQWPANLPGLAGVNGMWGIRTYSTEGYENAESLAATMAFLSTPEVICWTQSTPARFITPANWSTPGSETPAIMSLSTPDIVIPSTPATGVAQLTLKHQYNFEQDYDGGVLEYAIDGGPFVTLPPANITQNGYTGTPDGLSVGSDLPAWTGASAGVVTTIATIPGVVADNEVAVRFKGGWDNGTRMGNPNWQIRSVVLKWAGTTAYSSDLAAPAANGGLIPSGVGVNDWFFAPGSTVTRTGVVDTLAAELNYTDPTTNGGVQGVVLNSQPYPADTAADNNHVVTVAHSRITIATSAEYTFNHQGDDGFFLRVKAVSGANPFFRRVSGGGARTMSAPNEMFFPTGTGNTDTRGIIYLAAGQYDLDYVQWEGGGGFFYQLTMAQGAFIDNAGANGTDNWVPVGHVANNAVLKQPTMESPWQVTTSLAGALTVTNLSGVAAAIAGQTPADFAVVNFTDPQTNGAGPGRFGADSNWANNTAGDDDNYAISATGYLHIETTGLYRLGFDGDDGSDLIISGAPPAGFISIVENDTGAGVIEDFGGGTRNRLKTDVPTGQSRTSATIFLNGPSDYPITTNMYEIGGGSWFEVFGSAQGAGGTSITPAKANAGLVLLRSDPSYPAGIPTATPDTLSSPALSAQPAANLSLGVVSFSAGAGDAYSIGFPSTPGLSYKIEYSTDLVAWYKAGVGYGAAGASTTFSGNLTDLTPPLPDNARRVYWRVVGLY